MKETVKSVCSVCSKSCGLVVTLENGTPVKIKGDPDNPMTSGALCKKGAALLEILNHPDRIRHPLKRVGKRGEGLWQRISWDEAFDLAGGAFNTLKAQHGAESVAMVQGSAKGYMDTLQHRLANAFGTPNVVGSDSVCHVPRTMASELTFGFFPAPDYAHPPATVILWGINPARTNHLLQGQINRAVKNGAKVIVVDPVANRNAKKADLWLQIKPGADPALALGMINVIIEEGLYDREFVERWTVGFERLRAHVRPYSPGKVSEMTWLPAESIIKAARLYAGGKPGRIEWGNALDQQQGSFQAARGLAILMALTGNLGIPGGEIEGKGSGYRDEDPNIAGSSIGFHGRNSSKMALRDRETPENREKKIDRSLLPACRFVTAQSLLKSVVEKTPYPVRGMFVQAANPVVTWPDSRQTREALAGLAFMAVSEMFMTPTAALADVIFPVAGPLEFDGLRSNPPGTVALAQRKVAQVGECLPDYAIIHGLAKRLGLEDDFWGDAEDYWNDLLEPIGLTYKDFMKAGRLPMKKRNVQYRRFETHGFDTPTGKVELYSDQLAEMGFDPLPVYGEHPGAPNGALQPTEAYPLLCTNRKSGAYIHSAGRQIRSLRKSHPEPRFLIHPKAAEKYGVTDGAWGYIETRTGRIRQRARVTDDISPGVIVADYGWWFPEKGPEDQYGWSESNYNLLIGADSPSNEEMGSFVSRGVACKVYSA